MILELIVVSLGLWLCYLNIDILVVVVSCGLEKRRKVKITVLIKR
jgi:uncharacterized membrane protein